MIAVYIYLAAIVVANISLLSFGPVASIFNAFILIGLDLSLRDKLHDEWKGRHLWWKMLALILRRFCNNNCPELECAANCIGKRNSIPSSRDW